MSSRRYSEYKESGVKWLGSVPSHWDVRRYKEMLEEREERSSDGAETLLSVSAYTGVTPRADIIDDGEYLSRAESLEGYKVCYPNDLVMNIMLAWNRGLGVSRHFGIVSPAYSVFRIKGGIDPRFLDYTVRSDQSTLYYKAFSAGVVDSRLRLYPDTFGSLSCALPKPVEQAQIADFLDRETAKIDALIADQEKLLALLLEKRRATIFHAVTHGFNPSAPTRDSGIPWLGNVPAHWVETRVSSVCKFRQGKAHEPFVDENGEFICVNSRFVSTGGASRKYCTQNLTPAVYGDILMVMSDLPNGRALAKAYFVGDDGQYAVNQRVCALTAFGADPKFLYYLLDRNPHFLSQDDGVNQTHLTNSSFTQMKLFLPPGNEQRAIASELDAHAGRFDRLAREAERGIRLLKERRGALITAAVTGQIDVRGLVEEAAA